MRSGGSKRTPATTNHVQPDRERRVAARSFDRVGGRRLGNHQARRGDDALAMAALDRFVDGDSRVRSRRP